MKEEKLTSKHFERMFESIPRVSMKVFSYENINITDADVARAERYKMWCNGNAYIPPQDMVLYERSYRKINEINKNFKYELNMEEKMIYCRATDTLKCPKCGSKKIYVKSGMMTDLYICTECGFESRYLEDNLD